MNVMGYEVPQEVEQRALAWMQNTPSWRAANLEEELVRMGVPESLPGWKVPAHRAADRLIQRERKAGNIAQRHGRGLWSWVGEG